MTIKLRPYQAAAKAAVYEAWARDSEVPLLVLPTGAGKTVTFSDVIHDEPAPSAAIAHRQELVSQISLALARDGIMHRIVGPKSVVKLCVNLHMQECGRSYYNPTAPCAVIGIDTLLRRINDPAFMAWAKSVRLWVTDEAHHLLKSNKWGKGVELFPNARGLGVTATPTRADGKGLGDHSDGVFSELVVGPSMRDLINMGYLTDYRIFAPPTTGLDLDKVGTGSTGDFKAGELSAAVARSAIIGDVVGHYQRIAPGKLGVTFATDVKIATETAEKFNAAGVPAEIVSAKTPDADRVKILRRFKNRELLQLVNVDLFGEGFDLPAIEVVSMARPTQSYSLYVQQFGRALRLMIDPALYPTWDNLTDEGRRNLIAQSGKPCAIIIDHVGNVVRHGLPDAPREWTLDAREKRRGSGADDAIPVRVCPERTCLAVYERIHACCPFCGHVPVPAERSAPEFVDGDLAELDAATLAAMRGEVAKVDRTEAEIMAELAARYVPDIGIMAARKRHRLLQEAQEDLRDAMAWWAGHQRALGRSDSESYRRFYFKFGVDVLTAQTLKPNEANQLRDKIDNDIQKAG